MTAGAIILGPQTELKGAGSGPGVPPLSQARELNDLIILQTIPNSNREYEIRERARNSQINALDSGQPDPCASRQGVKRRS